MVTSVEIAFFVVVDVSTKGTSDGVMVVGVVTDILVDAVTKGLGDTDISGMPIAWATSSV